MTDTAEDLVPSDEGETVAKALNDGLVHGGDKHAMFMLTANLPKFGMPTGELSAYLFLALANADAITEALTAGLLDPSHYGDMTVALPSQIAAVEFILKRLKDAQAAIEAKGKAN